MEFALYESSLSSYHHSEGTFSDGGKQVSFMVGLALHAWVSISCFCHLCVFLSLSSYPSILRYVKVVIFEP